MIQELLYDDKYRHMRALRGNWCRTFTTCCWLPSISEISTDKNYDIFVRTAALPRNEHKTALALGEADWREENDKKSDRKKPYNKIGCTLDQLKNTICKLDKMCTPIVAHEGCGQTWDATAQSIRPPQHWDALIYWTIMREVIHIFGMTSADFQRHTQTRAGYSYCTTSLRWSMTVASHNFEWHMQNQLLYSIKPDYIDDVLIGRVQPAIPGTFKTLLGL